MAKPSRQRLMPLEYLLAIPTAQSRIPLEYVGILIWGSRANQSAQQDGKAEVIANEEGDRYIPSVLSYIEGEEYHGTQAKSQLVRNSKNTVAYFRDYLGKRSAQQILLMYR
jgi:hypothetical protein